MTAKEKCDELIQKYLPRMYCYMGSGMLADDYDEKIAMTNAKACALICCDEVLKAVDEFGDDIKLGKKWGTMFWNDVKKEINKL